MINEMILTAGPSITEKEISYVTDAVTNGWNNDWNKYLIKFEKSFSEYIGVKHSLSTSSCTGALHLAMLACGIGPGDEVIIPEITWVASASAVAYVGATPVFCDIDPVSWCMDLSSVERLVTSKTKAIMPVHLYGHPANMPAIMKFARANNRLVLRLMVKKQEVLEMLQVLVFKVLKFYLLVKAACLYRIMMKFSLVLSR